MADITLSNGKEITFDMNKISLREYRSLFDVTQSTEDSDAIICKAAGLPIDEYLDMGFVDNRALTEAFIRRAKNPLANPT